MTSAIRHPPSAMLVCALCVLCGASFSHAGATLTVTNYFPNYVLVTNGFANAGDTGLVAGKAYACFRLDSVSGLTTTNAKASGTGSDARQIVYCLTERAYNGYVGITSTNRSSQQVLSRTIQPSGTSAYVVRHGIVTTWTPTGSALSSE